MNKRIPNFNTISTLIDRLSIENVKLSHFQYLMEEQGNSIDVGELEIKIGVQLEIIESLKIELEKNLKEIFINQSYNYIEEERTFK